MYIATNNHSILLHIFNCFKYYASVWQAADDDHILFKGLFEFLNKIRLCNEFYDFTGGC